MYVQSMWPLKSSWMMHNFSKNQNLPCLAAFMNFMWLFHPGTGRNHQLSSWAGCCAGDPWRHGWGRWLTATCWADLGEECHERQRGAPKEGRSPKQSYSFLVSRGLFLKGGRFFVRGDVSFVCLQRQRGRINIIHVSVRSGSDSSRSGSVVVLRMANAITLPVVWLVLVVCLGDHRSDECSLTGNLIRITGNL